MRQKQKGTICRFSGRWYLRFWVHRTEDGTRVRKRETVPLGPVTTRSKYPPDEIVKLADEHMATVEKAKVPVDRSITVGAFAEQIFLPWADEYKRPSTARAYRQIWQRHLAPQFIKVGATEQRCADLWVNNVDTFRIQAWLDEVGKTDRCAVCKKARGKEHPKDHEYKSGGIPLSASTLKHAKFLLSGLFNLARKWRFRSDDLANPATDTDIPPKATPQAETHAYSPEEAWTMLAVLGEPARTAVGVAAYTGLRIGEIEGLRWEDVHGDTIVVGRSIWNGHVGLPKTKKSKAPVAIVRQLAELLKLHHARCGSPTSGPIFCTQLGTPLSMANVLNRGILPILNRCGICQRPPGKAHCKADHDYVRDTSMPKWQGWHAFRRGLATNLEHLGASVTTTQGAMRHSDANVTLSCYTKTIPGDVRLYLQKAGDALAEFSGWDSKRPVNQASGALPESVN